MSKKIIQTPFEKYLSQIKNLPDSKFVKLSLSPTGEYKFNVVVLSGCVQQWKKFEETIYLPGFQICATSSEILKTFLKDYCVEEDIDKYLQTGLTKTFIPQVIDIYSFDKNSKSPVIVKTSDFNFEDFYSKNTKNFKKEPMSNDDFLAKVQKIYKFLQDQPKPEEKVNIKKEKKEKVVKDPSKPKRTKKVKETPSEEKEDEN
jgi:hypothetical protein